MKVPVPSNRGHSRRTTSGPSHAVAVPTPSTERIRIENPRPAWSPPRCSTCTHTPVATSSATSEAVVWSRSSGQHEHRGAYSSRGATSAHQVARPCRTDASRRCRSSAGGGTESSPRPRAARRRARPGRAWPPTGSPATSGPRSSPWPAAAPRTRTHRRRRAAPRRTAARGCRAAGADLAPPGADAGGRVTVPLPVCEPHLQPDTPLHGGVHGVLRPVHRAALQVEGERTPPPRRRAGEAAEEVGGGLEHAVSGAPGSAPGPRGFG